MLFMRDFDCPNMEMAMFTLVKWNSIWLMTWWASFHEHRYYYGFHNGKGKKKKAAEPTTLKIVKSSEMEGLMVRMDGKTVHLFGICLVFIVHLLESHFYVFFSQQTTSQHQSFLSSSCYFETTHAIQSLICRIHDACVKKLKHAWMSCRLIANNQSETSHVRKIFGN